MKSGWALVRGLLVASLLFAIAGCTEMPVQGPTVPEITDNPGSGTDYVIVNLSPTVLSQLAAVKAASLMDVFGDTRPSPVRNLEKGDIVAVTVWDAGGGLFSPQGSATVGTQQTTIPNQTVDPDGDISVPYAGRLHVAGKSIIATQNAIINALAHKTVQPQALVSIVSDQSNLFTVIGDVKAPGRLSLDINGTRLLDAIARAGGATNPAYDTDVELLRAGVSKRVRLASILAHPSDNIYLRPDDTLYVVRNPETIAVLGATKFNARIDFDTEQMSLAEAVGKAGGLLDIQAEATGVFVFRVEPSSVARSLAEGPAGGGPLPETMPVIFRADLREPQAYFLAQSFKMQDKDVVYVANSESVQLDKTLRIILHAAEIVGVGAGVVNRTQGGVSVGGN